jgi:protein-L-isoaspartate O-methyltransferase
MLIPVGTREEQKLIQVTRVGDAYEKAELGPMRFVPLLGEHGWTS